MAERNISVHRSGSLISVNINGVENRLSEDGFFDLMRKAYPILQAIVKDRTGATLEDSPELGIPPDVHATLLEALNHYRGDDLERAQRAFNGMSEKELDKRWGAGGKTCREVLAEYEQQHAANVAKAIAALKRVRSGR